MLDSGESTDDVSRGSDGITVALTDDALRPAPRQYYPERRLLSATPIVDDPETELDLAERVLEEIVPLVGDDGEELPDIDDRGYVRYVDTSLWVTSDNAVDLTEKLVPLLTA